MALSKRFAGGAIKLSPGTPEGFLEIPGETEFIGVRDEVREQVIWTGDLAHGRLRATEIGAHDLIDTFEFVPAGGREFVADKLPATFRIRLPADGSRDRFDLDWGEVRSYARRIKN